jgi:undecaprenyl-diphosphatase
VLLIAIDEGRAMKLMQTIHDCDVSLYFWVMRHKSQKLLVSAARWISRSADGYLYLFLAAFLLWSGAVEDRQLLACMMLGLLMERPTYFVIKNCCRRDRPQASLNVPGHVIPSDKFSFPSGHTSAAFLMAGLISAFHPSLAPLLFTWASLVGVSRVILGVHFPTDTAVGALMGAVAAYISMETLLL